MWADACSPFSCEAASITSTGLPGNSCTATPPFTSPAGSCPSRVRPHDNERAALIYQHKSATADRQIADGLDALLLAAQAQRDGAVPGG
jgi:hypothetical protein